MSYNLLSVGKNPKIDKSNKVSSRYWSVIMHLRPVNTKICPYQDIAKCKSACLNTAGLGGVYPSIQKARQRKTDLFLNDRDEFMRQLVHDIEKFIRACDRKDKLPAIRLNGTSDIQWEKIDIDGQNIFHNARMFSKPSTKPTCIRLRNLSRTKSQNTAPTKAPM